MQKNVALAAHTSWLVGGSADFFSMPQSFDELKSDLEQATQDSLEVSILGGGSNVLVSDQGVSGLTISMKNLKGIQATKSAGNWNLEVWAGTPKAELLKFFLKERLAPALFLAGLPGDVGGGLVMNAGVAEAFKPREFCELIQWVEVLRPTGILERVNAGDLRWRYRHCEGWQPGVITKVGMQIPDEKQDSILVQVRDANHVRLQKQPLDMPSCGSVFRNPEAKKAAQLIDSCGLKGYTVGGAQVSTKHANFIVNKGGATAKEIWEVILHVQAVVWAQTGVKLETEVVRIGRW